MIEVIAQNSAQTKRPTIKMHKTKSARAKIWPFKNSFFNFCFCQSSRPIRNGCFGPPNFDRGLKTMISSYDPFHDQISLNGTLLRKTVPFYDIYENPQTTTFPFLNEFNTVETDFFSGISFTHT